MRREMTPEERILWNHLRQNRCARLHFRRQQVISGFIVDFYCDGARLAVELDGAFHDIDYDAERDRELAHTGVAILRMENFEVRRSLDSVLGRIATLARQRMEPNG